MYLQVVCDKMGYSSEVEKILQESGWDKSVETFPGMPEFMTLEFQKVNYPKIKSPINAMSRIEEVVRITERNKEAQLLAWHLHRTHFIAGERGNLRALPLAEKMFGDNAGVFILMIAISSVPLIEETTRRLGLPAKLAAESVTWLGGTVQIFAGSHNGLPGHTITQMFWLKFTIDGKLFRIGRFEYWPQQTPPYLPAVFVNSTGKVQALCPEGWCFNSAGMRVGEKSPEFAFKTELSFLDGKVSGTPFSASGEVAIGKTLELDLGEWTPALSPWDTVLDIHIPGGGGMTLEKIRESMTDAVEIFRKYFKKEIKLFVCRSWILNPEWETRLPDSNLAAFQREIYRFPLEIEGGLDGLFFLFGRDDGDPLTYNADNSARKAMLDVLREGGKLKSGGMFFLPKDLKEMGTQPYRK